jgi:hypothetical protein
LGCIRNFVWLPENKHPRIYFWNFVGVGLDASLSIVIIMTINRIANAYDAGIFTLGYANIMVSVVLSLPKVKAWGLLGAAGCYLISSFVLNILITAFIGFYTKMVIRNGGC